MPPPTGHAPVLLRLDYASYQPNLPEDILDAARYTDGTLRVFSEVPEGNQGVAATDMMFRDVIIQAQLRMSEGGDDDLYGLFLRSPSSDLYYAFAVTPSGQVLVSSYEGEFLPLVSGPLDPDMHFGYGLDQPNRFQVVTVGPSLTFMLNGMLVTAEIVDDRYQEGYLGFFVHHGTRSARAELAADWIEVRGVFPAG
jgi:3-keto-disaccharide hydrolase